MSNDEFWYQPKRPKGEVVAEAMSRLTFLPKDEPPPAPAFLPTTDEERRAFYERQDKMFANGYVIVRGAPYPLSKTLARQLNYDVDRLLSPYPGYDVAIEPEVELD